MRTESEIIDRVKTRRPEDCVGFGICDLIEYLPFEAAHPWLADAAKADEWKQQSAAEADVVAQLTRYMTFAWDRANKRRGLGALRSLKRMSALLWLLGEDDAARTLCRYDRYGKPQLAAICEHYGVDWRALDDGRWVDETGRHIGVEVAALPFRPKGA